MHKINAENQIEGKRYTHRYSKYKPFLMLAAVQIKHSGQQKNQRCRNIAQKRQQSEISQCDQK